MRLEYFQYLIEISRHNSMSEASLQLHLTPQALSVAIKKLESEFNTHLVATTNQGTVLTEDGKFLVQKSKEFLDAIYSLKNKTMQRDICEIKLYCAYAVTREEFMANLLNEVSNELPFLKLNINYYKDPEILDIFVQSDAQLCMYYNASVNGESIFPIPENLQFIKLFSSCLYCIVGQNSVLAKLKSISMSTIIHSSISILLDASTANSIKNIIAIFGDEKSLNIQYEENSILFNKKLENNDTLAFTMLSINGSPLRTILPQNFVLIKVNNDIEIEFGYLLKKTLQLDSGIECFTNFLNKQFCNSNGNVMQF